MLNKEITKRGGNLSVPTILVKSRAVQYLSTFNSRPKKGLMDFYFLENLNISEKLLFYVYIEFQSLQSIMNLKS